MHHIFELDPITKGPACRDDRVLQFDAGKTDSKVRSHAAVLRKNFWRKLMSDVSLHAEKSARIQSLRGGSLKPARFAAAALVYCAILLALWCGFHRSEHLALTGINLPRAFASFALLLAPLWFFAFGLAEPLKALGVWARILGAGFLALPYFVFALGTADFELRATVIVV